MKKKPIMMMATTLITLLLLTPMVKAGVMHYWWDNVYFVDGTDIDYPHPDNVYYDISKTTDWTRLGYDLYHCQINKDSTFQIIVGALAFSAFVGLVVTVWLGGGTYAALVGGIAGIALATFIQMVIDYYFVDERGCIWFWVSALFVNWLKANLSWLGPLCNRDPAAGYAQILIGFLWYGYLRVGMLTFHDALGIVGPQIYSLTISVGSGGTTSPLSPGTYECFEGTSVTVTADADSDYTFNYWVLDGATKWANPITVTMNSDHTLKAYFTYSSGGVGCPILSVFDGSDYVTEGLLDIHNPDGIDVVRNHTIITTPQPENNAFLLRLTEHPQTHSYMDQVKLFATLEDGTTIQLPLISAVHSEAGNVLSQLLRSDDVRTDTGANQTIDLKFAALGPKVEVVSFIFQIEGNNMVYKKP